MLVACGQVSFERLTKFMAADEVPPISDPEEAVAHGAGASEVASSEVTIALDEPSPAEAARLLNGPGRSPVR